MTTDQSTYVCTHWILLAATLAVGGLAGCSTCPAIEDSSIEQSRHEKIKNLLTSKEWETANCKIWDETKGKTEQMGRCEASTNNRRWNFKESGNGSYQDEVAGGATEWTEFTWKLEGNHLQIEKSGMRGHDFQVLTSEDSKLEWRHSKNCMYSVLRPYEKN